MRIISCNYSHRIGEAKATTTKSYNELDDVIKMDCLIDVIYELRNLQERLHKKMYRPNQLKNGIKEE
jgi:hypothetical protein